jgi:hypothetical protein
MSISRPPGIDRETAEHLLDGVGGMDPDQLPWILAAAAAPAHDIELAREEAAVTAIQAHLPSPVIAMRIPFPGRPGPTVSRGTDRFEPRNVAQPGSGGSCG